MSLVKRVLFQIGANLAIFSFLAWLGFCLNNIENIPSKELTTFVLLAGLLMLPELFYQLCQFFSSGSTLDD
jgi:hypothetical protein